MKGEGHYKWSEKAITAAVITDNQPDSLDGKIGGTTFKSFPFKKHYRNRKMYQTMQFMCHLFH